MTNTMPTPAEKIAAAKLNRYEHGGARLYWTDPQGARHLIIDLYDDEKAEMREYILGLLGRGAA